MGSKELTQLRDFHFHFTIQEDDLPGGTGGKELACQSSRQKRHRLSLGQEDLLEEGMASHSSILAWKIPWTEEPGGLKSMGLQRVRYD